MKIAQHDAAGRLVLFNMMMMREKSMSLSLRRLEDAWYVAMELPCREWYSVFHVILWAPAAARRLAQSILAAAERMRADEGGITIGGFCDVDGCEISFMRSTACHVAYLLLSYADLADKPSAELDMAAQVLSVLSRSSDGFARPELGHAADIRQLLEDRAADECVELSVGSGRAGGIDVKVGSAHSGGTCQGVRVSVGDARALLGRANGDAADIFMAGVSLADAESPTRAVRVHGRGGRWTAARLGAFAEAADIGPERAPVVTMECSATGLDE